MKVLGVSEGLDSQFAEFLAAFPDVRLDPADRVVPEVELLQRLQAVQPTLAHLRQVVVVHLPAGQTSTVTPSYRTLAALRDEASHLQNFHVAEPVERSILQVSETVSLQLQGAKRDHFVKHQALHAANPVSAQVSETHKPLRQGDPNRANKSKIINKQRKRKRVQVLEVRQVKVLVLEGGDAVPVELKNLQGAGQAAEAPTFQRGDPIVVQEPG